MPIDQDLPGADLVAQGVTDLRAGVLSPSSLLIAIGAPRLRRLGIAIPEPPAVPAGPEMGLYRLLWDEDPRRAHSRYNALIRRLVSFARAFEARQRAGQRPVTGVE